MNRLKTILTKEERLRIMREKKSILKGARYLRKKDKTIPADEYKKWLSWQLLEMIETIDRRTITDINLFPQWFGK